MSETCGNILAWLLIIYHAAWGAYIVYWHIKHTRKRGDSNE